MRVAAWLVSILLLPTALYAQNQMKSKQGLLCWQENRKLDWSDFQAKASEFKKNAPLFSTMGAYAAPELTVKGLIDSVGRNNFIVRVSFNQQRAWVRDSTSRTANLLAHEQLHFDICELIARRIRARIAHIYKTGGDVFDPKFTQKIPPMLAEEHTLHTIYDQETAHGLYEEEQAKWRERINRELASLSPYKSTVRTCIAN